LLFVEGVQINIIVPYPPARGAEQADQQFEQYRFTRTTSANDQIGLTLVKFRGDTFQYLSTIE
jgi:hypothetical protein